MAEKLRVLMTTDTVGGVWTFALGLAGALADRAEFHLATMGVPLSSSQRENARAAGVSLHESNFKLEWMDDPWNEVAAAGDWLLDLELRLQPQLIHLNNYAHGLLPWRAPLLVVGHSCVCSWWKAVHGVDAPPEWDAYRIAVSGGLQAAAVVVAPTHAMLQSLERLYGPFSDPRVVYNGTDCAAFAPARKEPFIFAAGRLWDHAKNVRRLGDIAAALPWPVYIAGDVYSPDGRDAHIKNLHPLGVLDRPVLAQWMARASIYALPARYEPFGLSVLEAALSGCALVVGDIPSLREVWEDAAWYVQPDAADALHDALAFLTGDAAERHALARRAFRRAHLFSLTRMADRYWDLYTELTGVRSNVVSQPAINMR